MIYEGTENTQYSYEQIISEKSVAINKALMEAMMILTSQVAAENRVMNLEDLRNLSNKFFIDHAGRAPSMNTKEFTIENKNDGYKIPVRLYKPNQDTTKLIVFVHGGAWMWGNLDTHDALCRLMAEMLNTKVIAIDYRLAPEYLFPYALEDVQSVYEWCANESLSYETLGDITKIYLSGDSAGGSLCSAMNLKLKNEKFSKHLPDSLILFYSALSEKVDTQSYSIHGGHMALTTTGAIASTVRYTGKSIKDPEILGNEYIFPIKGDAKNYPPTIMIAAGCDVLLDGQFELYHKLKQADIPVKLWIEPGAVHGFMTYGKEFDEEVMNALDLIKKWLA